MYKVVAKVLFERLKLVLDDIIASTQNAFIPQRQILDGVAVINEGFWAIQNAIPQFAVDFGLCKGISIEQSDCIISHL
jgi:hypothetical protein